MDLDAENHSFVGDKNYLEHGVWLAADVGLLCDDSSDLPDQVYLVALLEVAHSLAVVSGAKFLQNWQNVFNC